MILYSLAYSRRLAPLHGIRGSFWMVLAFSFEPWFWSSSTHALDYIWGTCSLVAALYYIERRQLRIAGLACALGFGFRPSSLLWIFPLFIRVVFIERRRWQRVLRFALWTAIPALIPASIIVAWMIASKSEAWAGVGWEIAEVTKITQYPNVAPILALYRLIELIGHIPAILLISAACYAHRARLFGLFRSGETWVWNYVLIFVCLFVPFVSLWDKPEYTLPALPGLFMILGRCISNNWWKVITAAFVFNAFVSFGFGHASPAKGFRIELATPSLRPGALLWYAERAQAANDLVSRTGSELSEPSQIVRADRGIDELGAFYVSSLLKRGPGSQARISCPLVPALLSYPEGKSPEISLSKSTGLNPPFVLSGAGLLQLNERVGCFEHAVISGTRVERVHTAVLRKRHYLRQSLN